MRIVFMGTSQFACPSLQILYNNKHVLYNNKHDLYNNKHDLYNNKHDIVKVYTIPSSPKGRGMKIQNTPIHNLADKLNLNLRCPISLRLPDVQNKLKSLEADILVVVSYGFMIPAEVLEYFEFGGINVHPSLLPRWRGASPIERAIENGDSETGVTIMQISESLDSGDILAQKTCPIAHDTLASQLHESLSIEGANLLLGVLTKLETGVQINKIPQDDSQATYAHKWSKAEALLDWSQPAEILERKIRAADNLSGCYFMLKGERVKVWFSRIGEFAHENLPCGHVCKAWQVVCGDGRKLNLQELQKAGSKRVNIRQFELSHGSGEGLNLCEQIEE